MGVIFELQNHIQLLHICLRSWLSENLLFTKDRRFASSIRKKVLRLCAPASAGESQSSNPNEGRIKNLINRVTITYETGPKA